MCRSVLVQYIQTFQRCAGQAWQVQLGTYWSNQLSPTGSVLCYPEAFVLSIKGGEVLIHGRLPSVPGFVPKLCAVQTSCY